MLCSLQRPTKYTVKILRDWQNDPKYTDRRIVSDDRHAWSETNEHDLITTVNPDTADSVSTWIVENLLPKYHYLLGKRYKSALSWDPASDMYSYSDHAIKKSVDVLATMISCLFSILSIVTLYLVASMAVRIAIVAAFTATFCFCLAVMTAARRIEIFAATSA
jgi:hypothetical protein